MHNDNEEDVVFLNVGEHRPETKITPNSPTNRMNSSSSTEETTEHPVTSFFTLFFKVHICKYMYMYMHLLCFFFICSDIASLGTYIFGTWFSNNFVFVFVLIVLTLACDFWVVKNVSGRLLVGLRWWNDVKEDGNTEWKFESSARDSRNNKEWGIFWYSLVSTPLIWALFALSSLVRFDFKWLPLTFVAVALNGAQLWGYWKCSRGYPPPFFF
ncbi:hypothetical protein RFI_16346 [Reticulomyxa filosa]|uniref:Golgi apparatus membrane protein TVP23 homolog n=1 Tax=Reticulomyxa filosa TaxID=46433 RepID=X6N4P7_RETFI|nr:hypothetical protein RFI_16346 [Reticulomyxa filosa]|eukprot:ETO20863.1 hypothetical protein RFI_16346 [Reticulomyxa filosa]